MLTEVFLNSCFSTIFGKIDCKKDKTIYRDIDQVLRFYKNKEKIDIPMSVQNKFDCLLKVCEMKLNDKTDENVFDSLIDSEKFKPLSDFLQSKMMDEISDADFDDNVNQIRLKKKMSFLLSDYDKLDDLISKIKDGSYDSLDDVVVEYEDVVKELFICMMESNRTAEVAAASSLDMVEDEFSKILERIVEKYSRKNVTPTGMSIFDNDILLNGGFEPSRLYLFGGGTGAGKSTLMENFIINASTKSRDNTMLFSDDKETEECDEVENVYVYVTLENTIDESFMRMYQCMYEKRTSQVLQDIKNNINIKQKMMDDLKKNNSTIVIKYFPGQTIGPLDLTVVIDDLIAKYGKNKIRGLYIDYLDLLRCDRKFEMYRLELSHITLSLKSIAVAYKIPVITLTQLARGMLDGVSGPKELGLAALTESIKKAEHSDFVCLLGRDLTDDNVVYGRIGKNRSGKSGISIKFKTQFDTFKFLSGSIINSSGGEIDDFDENKIGSTKKSFKGLENNCF